jgi:N-acetylmuramoyl-L-alanine amidase
LISYLPFEYFADGKFYFEGEKIMNKPKGNSRRRFWIVGCLLALAMVVNGIVFFDVYATDYKAAIVTDNGVNSYVTLDEAIADVSEGQTIRLLGPIEVAPSGESGVVNRTGVSFALDLGGQTITGNQEGALIQVNAGTLTVYNGQIINQNTDGLAIATAEPSVSSVIYPVGYQAPSPMESQLEIPAAYHINISGSVNGTIRYGSVDGTVSTLLEGALYAGGNASHTFYFVPDVGYKVAVVTINGVDQSLTDYFTLSNLTQDGSINVSFDKITFTIAPLAYANNAVSKRGLVVAPTPATVEYGGSQTFTYTVRNGFRLIDVLVNDVSIGAVTTIELNNITSPQNVKIMLEKTAVFIMLDAGHFENYNHSPVLASYYEGNTMWTYHKYLEQALEQYKNIIVDTTRINNSRAIGEALLPSQRGQMGEGYDLVLSVHSNACSSSSADHPVAIYTLNPNYTGVSKALGLKLATRVAEVMGTYEAPEVYGKKQSDGQDWYGVNRGAASVGVPSIILEHSFHTNYRATVWLSSDANLRSLALAEAKVIADFYGVSGETVLSSVKTPRNFAVYNKSFNTLAIRWDLDQNATGYEVYRSTSATTGFARVAVGSRNYFEDTGLTTGKAYYYKVLSYQTVDSKTVYSGFTSVLGARPLPATPAVSVVPGVRKATISWTYVPGASGYQIYRAYGTSGKYYRVKTITRGGTLKWTNYGRTKGKVYTYKVRPYRTVNRVTTYGIFSSSKSVRIK